MQGTQALTQQPQTGLAKLKASLNAPSVQEQFKNALKENSSLFVASIIDLYNGDKSLQTCSPNAIISEALKAAVLDLPINKALGFAYIVVYNNKVKRTDPQTGRDIWVKEPTPTFIPGYKGYIQLAMRTGQYRTINADVVYEGELQQANKLTGEISLNGQRKSDKVIGYFCYFELLNGYSKMLYMSVEDMAKYAKKYSPSMSADTKIEDLIKLANSEPAAKKVGWMGNFNDMALKTVIRRLISKYGYMSVKMQSAIASDIRSEQITTADRNEMIADGSREAVAIDTVNVQFEEVDTDTGEVTAKTNAEAAQPEAQTAPTPDY